MNNIRMYHFLIFLLTLILISGCSNIRDSAGVNRKSPDEFQAIENPPLVIPPNYSLIPPDQLQEKNIEDIEKELAKEILFGLENKDNTQNNQLTTMNTILLEANVGSVSNTIRNEIDEGLGKEISTNDNPEFIWEDETEILDAVKESERIREKNFNNESINEGETPIKIKKVKKKKKRFFFF